MKKIKLLLLISSLNRGGAERQVLELVRRINKNYFDCVLVTVHREGSLLNEIRDIDKVRVQSLNKRGSLDLLRPLIKLCQILRKENIDVIYAFEEGPSLLGLAARASNRCRIVWGIRNTLMNAPKLGPRVSIYRAVHRIMSRCVHKIVYNSYCAHAEYTDLGYPSKLGVTIPNGYDYSKFSFNMDSRAEWRRSWKIDSETVVFAVIGSFKPDKAHSVFIDASRIVFERVRNIRLLMVGRVSSTDSHLIKYAANIKQQIGRLNLNDIVIMLDEQADVAPIMSAVDILVVPSWREGMPNVIGEAMLCERPCIVSNVGDAAAMLGECGSVVNVGDSLALAECMISWANKSKIERDRFGKNGRNRVIDKYGMQRMIETTSKVMIDVVRRN